MKHPNRLAGAVGALAGILIVIIAVLVVVVVRLTNVSHSQATVVVRLANVLHSQATALYASNKTRVVTVTQRCALTEDVEAITRLDRNILLHFVPPKYGQAIIVAPYDKQLTALAKSYAGCEKQLNEVVAIYKVTPKP